MTSQESPSKAVKLSSEDQARMLRLREEVVARLEEMNLILSRNLGQDFHDEKGRLRFMPHDSAAKGESGGGKTGGGKTGGVEVPEYYLHSPYDKCVEEVGKNGCYDHCSGLCYVCRHIG